MEGKKYLTSVYLGWVRMVSISLGLARILCARSEVVGLVQRSRCHLLQCPGTVPPDPCFWRLQAHKRYKARGYWVKCMFTSATRHFHKFTSATKAANIGDYAFEAFAPTPGNKLGQKMARTVRKLTDCRKSWSQYLQTRIQFVLSSLVRPSATRRCHFPPSL
jgi:hypothetical protein